ncbi:YraN family protein [Hyphococcus sp. DH-69]|uniref:YraN family protein n=1 Tax=Hyphococcus formosus TaxID=3143534 RepID=UPI00398B7526
MANRQNSKARRQAERGGRLAEIWAALFLRLKGFSILAQRVRTPVGEIDIVARRGSLLIFAEVKARRDVSLAIAAVTPQNQRRIGRAAGLFLSRHQGLAQCAVRYDIIAIARWRVCHVKDAWRDEF